MGWIFAVVFLLSGLYIIWKIKQGERLPKLYFVPVALSVAFTIFVFSEGHVPDEGEKVALVVSAFVCAASWPLAKLWYGAFGRDIRRIKDDIRGRR